MRCWLGLLLAFPLSAVAFGLSAAAFAADPLPGHSVHGEVFDVGFGVGRLVQSPGHIRLAAAQPDFANQHVFDRHGIRTADLHFEGAAGFQTFQRDRPFTVGSDG